MALHTIQTVMRPDVTITVDEAEYERLLELGLVYSGDPAAPTVDFYDGVLADRVERDGSRTQDAVDTRIRTVGTSLTVVDATADTKGIVKLSGDLGGTAAAPAVVKIGGQAPAAVATSGAYGDLTGVPAAYTDAAAAAAVAAAASVAPVGAWNFAQAPTVAGQPIGTGGGGSNFIDGGDPSSVATRTFDGGTP